MKSLFSVLFGIVVLFGLLSPASAQTQVQVGKVDVKIEFDTQKTPEFQAGGVNSKKIPSPRDWLEIEVEFDVDARPRDAVIPKLMFKYYVAIQSKEGTPQLLTGEVGHINVVAGEVQSKEGTPQLLTGEVGHINVVAGEDSFSSAYVSPSSLGKITGDFRRFQASSVIAVAVAVFHNGELKGGASVGKGNGKWWEQMSGSPGVLGKAETPFALLWLDRYSDVEKSKN